MSAEQLQLVFDLVARLGAEGKSAFVWYLVCEKLPYILAALVIPVAVIVVVKMICNYARRTSEAGIGMRQIRDMVGAGSGLLCPSEINRSVERVREMQDRLRQFEAEAKEEKPAKPRQLF